ncbi:hypothetical protein QA645_13835 [Bradyrhizobium sp. CIAT3101]|uniref:hypothetical protein n=1 Tax=Bradyrhizobium sp. CIAT3101 TaxID=439387 RepID=UPI0024B062F4|nr:hypothetical protein [Bradyrhizobium sp. CIAT3101]WFU83777.1 hypothetical protein QA645_13835 [Bradyrhizobium sp. CIAT3101]
MRNVLKQSALLRRTYYKVLLASAAGQSDESQIVERLAVDAPRTFIEIGFHPIEFNCISLARSPDWRGLLIDGNERQVADAKILFHDGVDIVHRFLTLDNLDFIKRRFREVGILSIDVDGNDYWLLKSLIDIRPAVISVEYNASFRLEPVAVPYDESFDRHEKHPTGWYHGASITALASLCAQYGYGLAAVSGAGANAFFTPGGALDPTEAWRPNSLRDKWSHSTPEEQWRQIQGLPLISV